jgi:hypothetical protein
MAVEINSSGFSHLTAAADYSSNQYHLGYVDSSGTITLGATLGARVSGIINNEPQSGESVDLITAGVGKVRCGGTVTAGDKLVCAASGEAVTQTRADQYVVGRALEGGADNSVISMLLTHEGSGNASILSIPVQLSTLTNADVATNFIPGFAGTILSWQFLVTTAVTTGAKAATLNLEVGTTNVTGGTIALSGTYALGAVVAQGSAFTAGNTFTATDTISVEASSVTAFSEGAGVLLITLA